MGLGTWLIKLALWLAGLAVAGLLSLLMAAGVAMVVAYPNLPDVSEHEKQQPRDQTLTACQ